MTPSTAAQYILLDTDLEQEHVGWLAVQMGQERVRAWVNDPEARVTAHLVDIGDATYVMLRAVAGRH